MAPHVVVERRVDEGEDERRDRPPEADLEHLQRGAAFTGVLVTQRGEAGPHGPRVVAQADEHLHPADAGGELVAQGTDERLERRPVVEGRQHREAPVGPLRLLHQCLVQGHLVRGDQSPTRCGEGQRRPPRRRPGHRGRGGRAAGRVPPPCWPHRGRGRGGPWRPVPRPGRRAGSPRPARGGPRWRPWRRAARRVPPAGRRGSRAARRRTGWVRRPRPRARRRASRHPRHRPSTSPAPAARRPRGRSDEGARREEPQRRVVVVEQALRDVDEVRRLVEVDRPERCHAEEPPLRRAVLDQRAHLAGQLGAVGVGERLQAGADVARVTARDEVRHGIPGCRVVHAQGGRVPGAPGEDATRRLTPYSR